MHHPEFTEDAIGVPVSRDDCHKAALDTIREHDRTLSYPLTKGGNWKWHYLSPQTVLKEVLEGSTAVAEAYRQVLALRPNTIQSPWKMICILTS